jgi:anaerobic selenocysteine-containing dehydrogenase
MPRPADTTGPGTPDLAAPDLAALGERVSAARAAVEARGETFYQGASRVHLGAFPPKERWEDWVELSSRAWPAREEHHYMLVPTTCFNCESACGLLAYVDRETRQVRKFEGNPEHPGSRGRNCAKGPATINQVTDPDRVLYPMRRAGRRGEGRWERITWDEALDVIAARIRAALAEGRNNEIMVHLGRPGEDGYTERVLASWGVDGHNSHTNVCSSGGRTGFQFWMGIDRPSPDYAHAKVIYLISAHLETGHYFNPHAQRITQARENGAKVIVLDTRLSNTATHADYWLSPQPGSEAAMNLAIASYLIRTGRYDAEFVRGGGTGSSTSPSAAPTCRPPSRHSRTPWASCTPGSRSSTPRPSPGSTPRCSPRSPRWWPAPGRGSRVIRGGRRPPGTSAAGRCPGPCS